MKGRVLVVAGSDSGGGAGIQADIKTVTALCGYAATAITALTAQNTRGVFGIHGVPPAFIQQQMELVLEDIGTDAIKTGMLHSTAVIDAVADVLDRLPPDIPIVVDPVMVAQSGDSLLEPTAIAALAQRLLPRASLLTPNAPEAARLTGLLVDDVADMERAAIQLLSMGPTAVLVKGGHLSGRLVYDVLASASGIQIFCDSRIDTRHNHGTGCTLASAVATGLAQGLPLTLAIARARAYLREALQQAPGFGSGNGPIGHGHTVQPFPTPATVERLQRPARSKPSADSKKAFKPRRAAKRKPAKAKPAVKFKRAKPTSKSRAKPKTSRAKTGKAKARQRRAAAGRRAGRSGSRRSRARRKP
ncbi:MAG: bifunctional hydroxymethylpyrimidine kinase/phosphomethylpyrimidine kinase [Kiloniellales bacterium]